MKRHSRSKKIDNDIINVIHNTTLKPNVGKVYEVPKFEKSFA